MALVPQESTRNSNRTLDPSLCLGPQVGSRRVVLSGCTVGQVVARVVTTVMVPSVEQTNRGSKSGVCLNPGGSQSGAQFTYHILGFEEAALGSGCLHLQSFGIPQEKLKYSIKA